MLTLVTTTRGTRHAGRLVTLSLMLALIAGCKSKDTSAAGKLGIAKNGMAPVKLEVVAEAPAKKSK